MNENRKAYRGVGVEIPDFISNPGPELNAYGTKAGTYSVPITVDGLTMFPTNGIPTRCGLPLPLGVMRDASQVRLLDENKQEIIVQVNPDISSKITSPLRVEQTDDTIVIITGPLKLVISRKRFAFPGQIWIDKNSDGDFTEDEKVTVGGDAFVRLEDDSGKLTGTFFVSKDANIKAMVEARGPVRATVRLSGLHVAEDGRKVNPWILRLHAFAGQSYLQVEHTFINNVNVRRVHTMALGLEFPMANTALCSELPIPKSLQPPVV